MVPWMKWMLRLCLVVTMANGYTTTLWTSGNGFPCYRQPVVIAAEPTGKRLLAFVEGRFTSPCAPALESSRMAGQVNRPFETGGLNMRASDDGGMTWGPSSIIVGNASSSGPNMDYYSIVRDDSTGHLTILLQLDGIQVLKSTDEGKSWSAPAPFKGPDGVKAPTVGHGVQLSSGRLVVPAVCNASCALLSDDHGSTWTVGGYGVKGSRESTIAEIPCSQPNEHDTSPCLYINARNMNKNNAGEHHRYSTISLDGGSHFEQMTEVEGLVSPVTPHWTGVVASVIKMPGGDLVYAGATNTTARAQMTTFVSHDSGKTWGQKSTIWNGPAAYADAIALNATAYGVLYEAGTESFADQIQFTIASIA